HTCKPVRGIVGANIICPKQKGVRGTPLQNSEIRRGAISCARHNARHRRAWGRRYSTPIIVLIFLGQMIFAPVWVHAQTKTLRFGNQSVTLTSDKKSTPALVFRTSDSVQYYGYLVGGAGPGLNFMTSGGERYHLAEAPPSVDIFSAILADYPGVWTWDYEFWNIYPNYNNYAVTFIAAWDGLTGVGIWPDYHVQAMCSNTVGAFANNGNPAHAGNGTNCWCRLKRRADGANGNWAFLATYSMDSDCADNCSPNCAANTGGDAVFRTALLSAF
ncbi:MAG: hypothetical protein FWG39_02795, partial [Alphaproteobacteria bacterium]|nr:hypothetical protein [Alphaproteobacteria bacterium]